MAASHKGAISFGLVHIPIALYTATQDNDIHFNQLCKILAGYAIRKPALAAARKLQTKILLRALNMTRTNM